MKNILFLLALLPTAMLAQATLHLAIKDQHTGFALPTATVVVQAADRAITVRTDAHGKLALPVPAGRIDLTCSAANHEPLTTWFGLENGTEITAEILLDQSEVLVEQEVYNTVLVDGYVADAETGVAVAEAVVFLGKDLAAFTDENGYFQFQTSAFSAISSASVAPLRGEIMVSKASYSPFVDPAFLLTPGRHTLRVGLSAGKEGKSVMPTFCGVVDRDAASLMEASSASTEAPDAVKQTMGCATNASIRVGTSCSCNTCTGVSVMSLESYVQTGLDNEWISSWNANSLKAGAVAYRSYGAYYTQYPYNTTYDLASSTCKQVWDGANQATSCVNAAKATAGEVLQYAGKIAASEYSAENNQKYCADGFTGANSAMWPCQSDAVCAGSAANGHGRGMCQWGSQRWANTQAKDHVWILDHYYNIANITRCTLATTAQDGALDNSPTLSVAPNPANAYVAISATHLRAQSATLTLSDLSGRIIQTISLPIVSETAQVAIPTSALAAGMYLLALQADTYSTVVKVMVAQ